jgi:uncharacterized BrkB/YihY/UPF0761 family membrane protein
MALASWKMLKDAVLSFFEDEALTRGAATAFYTVTSVAPVLLIVVAITGRSPIGVTILRVSFSAHFWGIRYVDIVQYLPIARRANFAMAPQHGTGIWGRC